RISRPEIGHAVATLREVPLHSVNLERLPIPQGSFETFSFGNTLRVVLVIANLCEILPPVFVQRMPWQPESSSEQFRDRAFSHFHGANQDDSHLSPRLGRVLRKGRIACLEPAVEALSEESSF